jgi:predicted dehydrogenase
MKKIKIGLIGAGNIMKTRHLPALAANADKFEILGIVNIREDKAKEVAEQFNIPNYSGYERYTDLNNLEWFKDVEAVIIAIPPKEHYAMVKQCLILNKHILVEKPFVTIVEEGQELLNLAKEKNLIIAVNHNFQYSLSFSRLQKLVDSGELGEIKSFYSLQVSNETRRLPIWGDDLPLGLFYDESPHVFYLLRRFAKGEVKIENVFLNKSKTKENTPQTINIDLDANGLPGSIYINFESPICEWGFTIIGSKQLAHVDMFRDILTVLPNDGQHLMKEVFKTSFKASWDHWLGFFKSGFKYIQHKLHYGVDITQAMFYDAVVNNDASKLVNMSGEDGLKVNVMQHDVEKLGRREA